MNNPSIVFHMRSKFKSIMFNIFPKTCYPTPNPLKTHTNIQGKIEQRGENAANDELLSASDHIWVSVHCGIHAQDTAL